MKDERILEKPCQCCGKIMFRRKHPNGYMEAMTVWGRRKYCSYRCNALSNKENIYKALAVKMSSPPKSKQGYLARARKYRGDKCETCGTASKLQTHHKDRNWKDNELDNLMTLCAGCHRRLHCSQDTDNLYFHPPRFCPICGKKAYGKGYCRNHYRRLKSNGDPLIVKIFHDGKKGKWFPVKENPETGEFVHL